MSQDGYMIKFVLNFIPTMVFLVYFILLYKEQQEYDNYYHSSCYINNTTYPTDITQDSPDYYWITCSCGKRCRSVSPCVSLHTNDNNLTIIDSYKDKKMDCTFYEDPCKGNENPLILFDKMNRFIQIAWEYQNSTVSCYKNRDHPYTEPIYLNLKDVSKTLYIISGFLAFFMLINVYLIIRLFCYNDDIKKKRIMISHKIFP